MAVPQIPFFDLIAELSDPDPALRRAAITQIMRRRTARAQAFPDFVRLLKDNEPSVRKAAVKALAQLGNPQALPHFARLLNERSALMRLQAVKAFEVLGGAQVVPYLVRALGDQAVRVRLAALKVLYNQLGAQAVPHLKGALIDSEAEVRLHALDYLSLLQGAQAIQPLIEAMSDPSAQVRGLATEHLIQLGFIHPQVVVHLLSLTSHTDENTRIAAFRVLGRLNDARSFPALLRGVTDRNEEVRMLAVVMLGTLAHKGAVPPLLALCSDPVAQVRVCVAQALGQLRDQQAVEPLLKMLADADSSVAARAAWALENLRDPQAIPALATCFATAHSDLHLRGTTMKALSTLVMQAPDELARSEVFEQFLYAFGDSYIYIREDARKVLEAPVCHAWILQPLLEVLTRPGVSLRVRIAALKVLELSDWLTDPQPLDALLALVEREDEYLPVRTQAMGLLAKQRDIRALQPLLHVLAGPDLLLREAASEALGLLGDERALEPLHALLAQTAPGYLAGLIQEAIQRINGYAANN